MEPVTIALGLAQILGPKIAAYFGGDSGKAVADEVLSIARKVTGQPDSIDATEAIHRDPVLAAEFKRQVLDNEHKLKALLLADKADARAMYRERCQMADVIAKRVMTWNLPALLLLAGANIPIAIYVQEAGSAQLLGNLLGAACQHLWQERRTIVEFFFGAGLGSENTDPAK